MARFVIHDHLSKHPHHDLRLEMDGRLISWAIPKGISRQRNVKRLAIQVEPHSLAYINYQGRIAEGEYGAGMVKILDRGGYKVLERDKDHMIIEIDGNKVKGHYVLRKFRKDWLLWRIG